MPESDYVFVQGDRLIYGDHGETDYLFHSGEAVPNTGEGELLFESGTAVGGIISEVLISDSQGETEGQVVTFSRSKTVESFYDFETGSNYSAATGEINDYMDVGYTTFFVFENSDTGELSFGFCHDQLDQDSTEQGGEVDFSISGLPDGGSFVVRDDDPGNDTYSYNGDTATADQQWGSPNTDGLAIGKWTQSELAGSTVTFDVTRHTDGNGDGPPHTVRFAGDSGTTVSRSYDGTNTSIQITFGNVNE